ncbi:hypothetical protein [Acidithrix sp. C25]|uniref:hypothetical protein n=1 Tax=Acidithrix sp. C25 TaxID=1671482 RepID=UPI00191B9646|nr:hypothetical protein [Acidithrix sp. C25]CAG4916245.1 unnamed protein product [Acidithrix sp. C25]
MAHGRLHIYLQDAKSNLSRAYIDELEGEVRDRIVLLARAIKAISANRQAKAHQLSLSSKLLMG